MVDASTLCKLFADELLRGDNTPYRERLLSLWPQVPLERLKAAGEERIFNCSIGEKGFREFLVHWERESGIKVRSLRNDLVAGALAGGFPPEAFTVIAETPALGYGEDVQQYWKRVLEMHARSAKHPSARLLAMILFIEEEEPIIRTKLFAASLAFQERTGDAGVAQRLFSLSI